MRGVGRRVLRSCLLAELKRGVPFFGGRYVGHMNGEQTIASQIGYLAAMLHNPNNVAIEASPVTTRLELEVAAELARMIEYDPTTSWGHLGSSPPRTRSSPSRTRPTTSAA